ncbi:MAG TPA: glycosyl hydrolase family 28 protein, partial [Solirubrobacteraceae bacterium]|nr:glycosyl hydrolase family 28 protein [Solirubrobacteraceae bacterium]
MQTRALVVAAALAGLVGLGCANGSGDATQDSGDTTGTGGKGGGTGTGGTSAGSGGTTSTGTGGNGAAGTSGAAGKAGAGGTTGTGGSSTGGVTGTGGTAGTGVAGATGRGGGATGGAAGGTGGNSGAAGQGATGGTGGTNTGGSSGTAGHGTGGGTSTGGATGTGGASDPCSASNAAVPLPTIGSAAFNVTTYGAIGDGKTDNTTAIQAALTAAGAAGGGTVTVPSGTFLSGPIVISSGTRLDLASGAVLKMLPMASYPTSGVAFITSTGTTHDIALTGAGTIDGQGQDWWDAFANGSTAARPQEVSLGHVTRVQVSGIRLQNSPEEHIWVKSDTDVTITGITIATPGTSGKSPPKNTDGVDVSATGMYFCNNNVVAGDDNIAMGGTNLYLGYSTFGVGHGCSIGSITQNGVSGVT